MQELPIYSQGRPAGTLTRRKEGLYTVFEARLPPADRLSRLYLFDTAGKSLCLGVMEPRPAGRFLRRKLSRTELSVLAQTLSHAAAESGAAPPWPPAKLQPGASAPPESGVPLLLNIDGRRCLALPCAPGFSPRAGLRLHCIAGQNYLLFRY